MKGIPYMFLANPRGPYFHPFHATNSSFQDADYFSESALNDLGMRLQRLGSAGRAVNAIGL